MPNGDADPFAQRFHDSTGSKVIGHVTQAQARAKGDPESILAIQFDRIEYSKDESIPMKGTLQAVAPSLGGAFLDTSAGPPQLATAGQSRIGGGANGGSNAPPTSSVQVGGPAGGTPILHADNKGVVGVKNLQMNSDGELSSAGKEVKLESGMQLMIHVEIQLASR